MQPGRAINILPSFSTLDHKYHKRKGEESNTGLIGAHSNMETAKEVPTVWSKKTAPNPVDTYVYWQKGEK